MDDAAALEQTNVPRENVHSLCDGRCLRAIARENARGRSPICTAAASIALIDLSIYIASKDKHFRTVIYIASKDKHLHTPLHRACDGKH
jgi:hypothetical protein